ncbi:MAG: Ig domain-containing protein [bacterium]
MFDPEVIFDTQSNRFFAMAAEQVGTTAGRFLLAVSDDADPNGTWYKYAFDVTAEAGDYYIDSPNIAVDSQAVYLTADFFSPTDKYLVHILNKADVLAGNPPASTFLLITGRQSFGLPVTYDPAAPAQYMIEAIESGTPTIVRLHAITNPLGTPSRVETTLTVPAYTIPPEDPPQMGTSTRPELFEARFWSCTYRNGSLWAVHHENSSRVRVRWYEVKMNGWPATSAPSLAQEGEIDLGGTIRTFFPSIWTDAAGNAAITFARSSPTEFISMNRALRLATDPPNTFGGIQTEQTGSTYNDSGRWGDYSGTMSDPAMPGSFWGVHEYAVGTSAWNTWIARYDAPACPLITLSPAALPAGSVGTPYSQTITASGGTTPYTFAVTAGTLPPGLALAAGGVLSGTPTTAGSSTFTVTATDSASCQGQLAYTLVIGNPVDYVVGNGLGFPNPNSVRVYTAAGTATPTNFQAYGAGQWGTVVSAGDVNGGGRDEILTGPGPGAVYGPHVRAFDNTGTGLGKVSYFAYGTLRYGVNVARARLDADAYDEILTGAGAGPVFGPHVRGWNFDNTTITALAKVSFFAYGTLQWGVNVEDGDVDADGYSEILTGPGPGPSFAPQIRGFDYDGNSIAAIAKINFGAFPTTGYGVNVAGATVEADAYDEIAAAPGPGPTSSFPSRFRGFNYDAATISALPGFDITPFTTFYGGRVGLGDFTLDGVCELIAGAGPDPVATAVVDAFAYNGSALTAIPGSGFVPFAGTFGVNVGAGFLGF